jgi:hypothetical protein
MKLTADEFNKRLTDLLEVEQLEQECWWYLSFASYDCFLGAAIVRGRGLVSAFRETHRLGLNPGGEVLGLNMPSEWDYSEWTNRLLTWAECEELPEP